MATLSLGRAQRSALNILKAIRVWRDAPGSWRMGSWSRTRAVMDSLVANGLAAKTVEPNPDDPKETSAAYRLTPAGDAEVRR